MPSFFDLPAELRNTIYEYAATEDKAVPAYLMYDTCKMLFVNKQMRLECLPIYFESNTFFFDPLPAIQSDHPRVLLKYGQSIEWFGEFRVEPSFFGIGGPTRNHDLYSPSNCGLAYPYNIRLSLCGPLAARCLELRLDHAKLMNRNGAPHVHLYHFVLEPNVTKTPRRVVTTEVLGKYMASKKGMDWGFVELLKAARFIQRQKCFVAEATDGEWGSVVAKVFQLTTAEA